MSLTPQWLDELRSRTLLSALIGRSVKVTRAGREWKACCPFHQEKTPSFTINDEKGFYHCFGCGAHGDAIRWMTDQRGLPFMDAVKELAASAGMDVPAADPHAAKRAEAATSLRDVTEASAAWFSERLAADEGASVRDYLVRRGLSAETVAAFALGYAPDARGRLREVLKRFGDAQAVEAGMLIQPQDDRADFSAGKAESNNRADPSAGKVSQKPRDPYDRFRGRLMIPIRDARGRVIAFGGRIMGDGEPKYLNSPDTPLFDKGRILYNLDRAAPAARKANRLIVVEGYMDVIALAQAGIHEAVAPLGTALTEAQIELAWRQVPVPILAFDGDAAGQRAALRAANRALPHLRPGHSLAFVTLPAGQDPDDVVKQGGAGAFEGLVGDARPLVDLLWATAITAAANTPEERAAIKAQLMGWTNEIADADIAALYRANFRERFDDLFFPARAPRTPAQQQPWVPRQSGNGRFPPRPPLPTVPTQRKLASAGQSIDAPIIAAILGGLLRHPHLIAARIDAIERLTPHDPRDIALIGAMTDAVLVTPGLDTAGLLTILAPLDVYNRAMELLRADGVHFSFTRAAIAADPAKPDVMEDGHLARIAQDLDEVLTAVAVWPDVERAMADADEQVRERLDEENWQEQQRIRVLHADLRQRMMDWVEASSPNSV